MQHCSRQGLQIAVSTKSLTECDQRCGNGSKQRMQRVNLAKSSDQRFCAEAEKPVLSEPSGMARHKKRAPHTSTHPSIGPEFASASRAQTRTTQREQISCARIHAPTGRSIAAPARPVHATRAQHGCAKQGQPHDGAKATKTSAPQAAPCGAARFNSRTRHLRAGGLAAPVAQTRCGPHDGYQTKSCGVFE